MQSKFQTEFELEFIFRSVQRHIGLICTITAAHLRKGKAAPVQHKRLKGNGGTYPLVFTLGTWWKWAFNVTSAAGNKNLGTQWITGRVGPKAWNL